MPNKALQACFGADPSGLSRKFVYKFDAMHAEYSTVAAVYKGVNEFARGYSPPHGGGECAVLPIHSHL